MTGAGLSSRRKQIVYTCSTHYDSDLLLIIIIESLYKITIEIRQKQVFSGAEIELNPKFLVNFVPIILFCREENLNLRHTLGRAWAICLGLRQGRESDRRRT